MDTPPRWSARRAGEYPGGAYDKRPPPEMCGREGVFYAWHPPFSSCLQHKDDTIVQCPRTVYTDLSGLWFLATFGETGSFGGLATCFRSPEGRESCAVTEGRFRHFLRRSSHALDLTKSAQEPNGIKLVVTYYHIKGYGNSCRVHSRAVWTGACSIPCCHASVHDSDQLPQLLVRDS